MEQESTTPTLIQHTLKWGLISGAISILIIVLMYVIDYTMMVQLKFLFVSLAITLGVVIYAGIDYRNAVGGYLSYGKAWQHGIIMMAFSGILYTIFNMLMHFVIDPDLASKLTDASIENTREMMEGFGTPEDQMDKALEDARARTANQFTLGGMALGYAFSFIFYAIMAAISAIFVRRNEPVENM